MSPVDGEEGAECRVAGAAPVLDRLADQLPATWPAHGHGARLYLLRRMRSSTKRVELPWRVYAESNSEA